MVLQLGSDGGGGYVETNTNNLCSDKTHKSTHALTVTVAAGGLHQPVVLVIAHHGLVAVALPALLDVSLDLHSQDALHSSSFGQDAVGPVPHRLGVVLVAGTVLGLA